MAVLYLLESFLVALPLHRLLLFPAQFDLRVRMFIQLYN